MAMVPATDSRWKHARQEISGTLTRGGRWLRAALFGGPWTALRIAAWAASVFVALVCAAVLWLYFLDWNTMRGPVARYASQRLGRPVRIEGDLAVDLFRWSPVVTVSGLKVANPDWAGTRQAADIPHLAFSFRLLPFLFGNTILPFMRFDSPDIVVMRRADGASNWDFGDGNTGWTIPPIQRFLVRDGHIRIDDRVRKLVFTGTVSSQEYATGSGSAFQLTGDGSLNGNKFAAEVHGSPLINVDLNKPYAFKADLRAGATHVAADGAITHPFHLGQFVAMTSISGDNLSNLYYLTGLAMPQTAPYHVAGRLTRDGALYTFQDFSGAVGSSDLHGTLKVDASGATPFISGTAASRVLDFKDLGTLFGGKSQAAIASGRLLPDLPLHVDRLRQMDADVDYDAETIRSRDFPLRGVRTHIALKNSVLVLKPLAFQFAYGRLSGTLSIDARNVVPVTTVDARVTDIKVQQFLGGGDAPAATGMLEARARLEGSGNSVQKVAASANGPVTLVVPSGSFNEKLAELTGIDLLNALFVGGRDNTHLRCAVAHFETRGGVMSTQNLVFDTDPVRIDGKGSIDLRNETLDMIIAGRPKEFRIGRLRTPITVRGPLAHPAIGVQAGPLALQGGIAIALGILFPPAAILPFVDPGLEKDANCAGLLTQAKGQGAPVRAHR